MNKPYRLGVNALVFDKDNNVLLIQKHQYKENEWNFVGGGKEEGETLEENLFRELDEELGAKKDSFEVIGICPFKIEYDFPPGFRDPNYGDKYKGASYELVVLKFLGDKKDLTFSPEEFKTHRWIKNSEVKDFLTFPNQYSHYQQAIGEFLPELL